MEEKNTHTDAATEGAGGDLAQTARDVGSAARERLHDLRDTAQSSLEDVKSAAGEKTDEVKSKAADEIGRTADGLTAAADAMEGSPLQQDLLREAADGLKQISRALQGKSVGAVAADLSEFGRQNPLALLGGAALAGFALARFARASAPHESAHTATSFGRPMSTGMNTGPRNSGPTNMGSTNSGSMNTGVGNSFDEQKSASDFDGGMRDA